MQYGDGTSPNAFVRLRAVMRCVVAKCSFRGDGGALRSHVHNVHKDQGVSLCSCFSTVKYSNWATHLDRSCRHFQEATESATFYFVPISSFVDSDFCCGFCDVSAMKGRSKNHNGKVSSRRLSVRIARQWIRVLRRLLNRLHAHSQEAQACN